MDKIKIVSASGYSVSVTNLAGYCCPCLLCVPHHLHHLQPATFAAHTTFVHCTKRQTSKLILIKKVWFGVYLLLTQGRGSSFKALPAINLTKMRNKLVVKFDELCIQSWASGQNDRKGQSQLLFLYSGCITVFLGCRVELENRLICLYSHNL